MSARLKKLLFVFGISAAMWGGIIATASFALGAENARLFYYTKVYPGSIAPVAAPLALLNRINGNVNARIEYRRERGDVWQIEPVQGDCEDFAITKLIRLHTAGVPLSAMRLARGEYRGQKHMVLIVYVGRDQWVLDNVTGKITRNRGRFTPITKPVQSS